MDIFLPIALCVVFLILFSICGWCCKRKREGTVYGYGGTGVTVSTQPISASPVVVPPYPVDARHPTPHAGAPAPGFAPQTTPYPTNMPYPPSSVTTYYHPSPMGTAPYPPNSTVMPYPPPGDGFAGEHNAYPPTSGAYAQPPPYDVAVSQPPVHPPAPMHEVYGKQAPYNPHY